MGVEPGHESSGDARLERDVKMWEAHIGEVVQYYGLGTSETAHRELALKIVRSAAAAEEAARRERQLARVHQQGQICALVAAGRSQVEAAHEVGIAADTMYRWRREDPRFRTDLANARKLSAGATDRPSASSRSYRPAKMTEGVRKEIIRLLREGATCASPQRAA